MTMMTFWCFNYHFLVSVLLIQSFLIAWLVNNCVIKQSKCPMKNDEKNENAAVQFSSSVFCFGENRTSRECRFQNLCYEKHSDLFVFVHGENSRVYGIGNGGEISLDLSSVANHSAKFFSYKNLSWVDFNKGTHRFIRGSSILFHRFNPENLMHVLHDDVIPLYHTQRKYFPNTWKNKNINYIFTDGRPLEPFLNLYKIFSNSIITKSNLTSLTCFEDVLVGISKITTWYQYGFHFPQGPLIKEIFPVDELLYFKHDFYESLKHTRLVTANVDLDNLRYIVLFSRSITRRITNENEFVLELSIYFRMTVHIVNLETDDLIDIIQLVSQASILIGVHGAHLITSLFMKSSGVLIEIYPYAIPPENYTPYKTLARYLNIKYIAWENPFETNSRSQKDALPDNGGISHLPVDTQRTILTTKQIPQHICCKDPFWLFRINQDTHIDWYHFQQTIDNHRLSITGKSAQLLNNLDSL